MDFQLLSATFEHEGDIPELYTCKGKDVSPPLTWKNPPEGTKSFALIMEDLDTPLGKITHWVVYNIPSDKRGLPEAIPGRESLPDGTIQGKNWMRRNGYMGPCPLWGRHRYEFKIFALNTVLQGDPGMNKSKLLKAIKEHILGEAALMGYYLKKKST